MSTRMNQNKPFIKTKDIGGGQKLQTFYGKDSSDMRDVSSTKMAGGMDNYSHSMPSEADKDK